jgi:serine/threonine protein kinase
VYDAKPLMSFVSKVPRIDGGDSNWAHGVLANEAKCLQKLAGTCRCSTLVVCVFPSSVPSLFSVSTENGCKSVPMWVATHAKDNVVTELIMEKMSGPNLSEFIKPRDRGPDSNQRPFISMKELSLLLSVLFEKVADLHTHGYLHRDLKLVTSRLIMFIITLNSFLS